MILAGDIGGTHTRLQLLDQHDRHGRVLFEHSYLDDGFPDFDALLARFLIDAGGVRGGEIDTAVLGVAGPVSENRVQLSNRPWRIEGRSLKRKFGLATVRLVNDFAAAAHGIALLSESELVTLQAGKVEARAPRLVIGAGTGLGVAFAVWSGRRYRVIEGEGGNAGFAPCTPLQAELWRYIHARAARVSIEDVVSGRGLVTVCEFLREREPALDPGELAHALQAADKAAAVASLAMERRDPLAERALVLFVQAYGAAVGDYALAVLARGGVFVAGGIAPRIISRLRRGEFLAAFRAKGRFAALMARIPVRVVSSDRAGLLGAAAIARERH